MIPLLLFLLGCAVVYVGTIEAAFTRQMRLSLRLLGERNGRHELVGRYLDEPILLLVPARLLLGLLFAAASVLLALLVGYTGLHSVGVLLLSIGGFILLNEHLLPALIARRDPERVLAFLLPSFHVVARFLQPLTAGLAQVGEPARREGGEEAPAASAAAGAATEAAPDPGERHEEPGLSEREERRLLQSIVEFGDTLVREVMTPRPDIVAVPADITLDELRAVFAEQEYSRIPVYKDSFDNILGFVFVKDLIQMGGRPGTERPLPGLLRPAYVVPETKRVADLLKEFQRRQFQIATVVDEYGGTAGLVTLEDLLEEIVGEIRDEYDVEAEPITDEGNGVFLVSGKVDIDKVAARLGIEIERQGFETVGGYLLSQLGRVPAAGESFDLDGLSVEVLEAERRRVHKVRIRREPADGDGRERRGTKGSALAGAPGSGRGSPPPRS